MLVAHMQDSNHILQCECRIAAKTPLPTTAELKLSSNMWIENAFLQRTLSAEHYERLKNKMTTVTTEEITPNELNDEYAPTSPAVTAHQKTPLRDEVIPQNPLTTLLGLHVPQLLSPLLQSPAGTMTNAQQSQHLDVSNLLLKTQPTGTTPSYMHAGSLSARTTQPLHVTMPPPAAKPEPRKQLNGNGNNSTYQVNQEPLTPLPQPTPHVRRAFPDPDRQPSTSHLADLPPPKRRCRDSVVAQLHNTPGKANLIIAHALDNILDRMEDIEYKVQLKITQVCEAQTEDIVKKQTNGLAEEGLQIRKYTRDLISIAQENIIKN
jgi:hypothetical protein